LKETDVVVAVRSASVNWVDLLMTSGQYQHMPSPPYTPGLEYSGDIAWAGAAVDPAQVKVGDRVLSDGFWTGPRSLGDYQQWGGFASYAVAPAYAVIKLPERLTYDQGCNLLGNYETAYHCLVTCGKLRRGETVLILGASGSTGLAAVQIAKLLEAKVIAAGRSPAPHPALGGRPSPLSWRGFLLVWSAPPLHDNGEGVGG
jgi:NADPH2:quinone reductase